MIKFRFALWWNTKHSWQVWPGRAARAELCLWCNLEVCWLLSTLHVLNSSSVRSQETKLQQFPTQWAGLSRRWMNDKRWSRASSHTDFHDACTQMTEKIWEIWSQECQWTFPHHPTSKRMLPCLFHFIFSLIFMNFGWKISTRSFQFCLPWLKPKAVGLPSFTCGL